MEHITSEDLLNLINSGALSMKDVNSATAEYKAQIARKVNEVKHDLAVNIASVLDATPDFSTDAESVGEYLTEEYHSNSLTTTFTDKHGRKWRNVLTPVED